MMADVGDSQLLFPRSCSNTMFSCTDAVSSKSSVRTSSMLAKKRAGVHVWTNHKARLFPSIMRGNEADTLVYLERLGDRVTVA